MARATSRDYIPNQVFLGLPWRTVRPKYERAVEKLEKQYPLTYVIVGRDGNQSARDLLDIIKRKIQSSSYAIFDASGGNANVSMEYGLAEAWGIDSALYLCEHRASRKTGDGAIISDLAGKMRNPYKVERTLQRLLAENAAQHPYTVMFEKCVRDNTVGWSAADRRNFRTLALILIHQLDGKDMRRRADLIQGAVSMDWEEKSVIRVLKALHESKLLSVSRGRFSEVVIPPP